MPKKGKKSKGKGKGKKKKDSSKKDSIPKMIERNTDLWEAKLKMMEFQKEQFRDSMKHLVEENTTLVDFMNQTEKDTMDVVSYLKRLDAEKDDEIERLKYELKHIVKSHDAEKEAMANEFNAKLEDMQIRLDKKQNENELIQNELSQLKEFRKRKIQMQKELEDIKEAMVQNEKEHTEQMNRVEEKFFEEKMRLQREANKKIDELAEKAHEAAIKNLDEITRNIYKENVQLTESYKINMEEIERLKKQNKHLKIENDKFKGKLEDTSSLMKEKVEQANKQSKQIKELENKVELLEKALSQVVREFEVERENLIRKCKNEIETNSAELEYLRRAMELKNKEMNKVKKLAKNILQQRADIEQFFLDSLDYVRKQISTNRSEYRKEATKAFNQKMVAAHLGQIEYPKIRTFAKKFDAFSTNSVYRDLEQAEKWCNIDELIDLSELTWEQREQVLRELFARMNGNKAAKKSKEQQQPLAIESNKDGNNEDEDEDEDTVVRFMDMADLKRPDLPSNNDNDNYTFITQPGANGDNETATSSSLPKLPSIKL